MGNSELAIRFTENYYATKSEVSRELKMSLIDNIWSDILTYRGNFYHYLTLRGIDRSMLSLCMCPNISNQLSSLQGRLMNANAEYLKLNIANGDLKYFEMSCRISALKSLAAFHQLDVSENFIRSIINGTISESNDSMKVLSLYNKALDYVKDKHFDPIDNDFVRGLYAEMTGSSQPYSFFRMNKDANPSNRVIIDRIYTSAPVESIDSMMSSLYSFIEKATIPNIAKAMITHYYVSYVRPFDNYNDEMALLMMKAVLAHFDLLEFGVALPLESLLLEAEELTKMSVETQKTHDVTYYVNVMLRHVGRKCEEVFDIMTNQKKEEIKKEIYQEEVAVKVPEEKEEALEAVMKKEETVEEKKEPAPTYSNEIAISYIPPELDEKQAARLENHLLELDPSLRKGEAKFYARHCTLGKSYTIAQYKKAIGCVYETARTSMDHLVELGYYRKDRVNNKKNVYTPIARK